MEGDPPPVIPDYFVGDIVAVTEFKKPNIGNKIGVKVLGGIARVTNVNEQTCDLNYYLEGRRVKEVPFEYMRRAPPSFDSISPVLANNNDGADASTLAAAAGATDSSSSIIADSLPGSWEAQALRQAETLARAGSKRERKQTVNFEITKHKPQKRNKQAKPSTSSVSAASTKGASAGGRGSKSKTSTSTISKSSSGNIVETTTDENIVSGMVDIPELPVLPRNTKAFKQGKWRREPFDFRESVCLYLLSL